MDSIDPATRSRVMAAVKSNGNRSTERRLRAGLSRAGVRGWRMQLKELPGAPDFVFEREHLAIFADGCFWHGCSRCYRRPSSSRKYWDAKVQRNMKRDTLNRHRLERMNWSVMRIWEHDLNDLDKVIRKIVRRVERLSGARLRAKGWKTGTAADFLGLSQKEFEVVEKTVNTHKSQKKLLAKYRQSIGKVSAM